MAPETGSDASTLLNTAIEKLLYLESRLDSSEAAREDAQRVAERHRLAAKAARQALADWQKRAADAEVASEGAERQAAALRASLAGARQALDATPREAELASALAAAESRIARFQRERDTWLDRMVALQRLGGAGEELDLGAFISELRAELLALRRGDADRPQATMADRPAAVDRQSLLDQAPSGSVDPEELIRTARLPRAERTLATLCARDLAGDSALARRRAAERLAQGGVPVLVPLVASLLGREPDGSVRVAFVRYLGLAPGQAAALALARALSDPDPRVRAAALDTLARQPGADLSPGLHDASPAVRRRALALLPRAPSSIDALADGLDDADSSVRRVAALALAAQPGAEAIAVLQVASRSADAEVHQVASRALARRAGTPGGPVLRQAQDERGVGEPSLTDVEQLALAQVRASLRGSSLEELTASYPAKAEAIGEAVGRLLDQGRLVRRGLRLYQP